MKNKLLLKKIFDDLKKIYPPSKIISETGITQPTISKITSANYYRNISPAECKVLHDLYGVSEQELYAAYMEKEHIRANQRWADGFLGEENKMTIC